MRGLRRIGWSLVVLLYLALLVVVSKWDAWLKWFPDDLLLLIPGILVLAFRAFYELLFGEQSDEGLGEDRGDPNAWLILVSLFIWIFTLFWLHLRLEEGGTQDLTFFLPDLTVPFFVPVFGFLGALIFMIDLFRRGRKGINVSSEFAMRLVLGPYVAMVIVIFFKETFKFIQLSDVKTQAALAFFSGFLVVLVLQNLAERGNEVLGRWRERYRYEPSEIARKFKLDRDDDLKLKGANLKYLAQLRSLQPMDLRTRGRQAGFGDEFLQELQRLLQPSTLRSQLSEQMWNVLNQHGVTTLMDVALLTRERIQQICDTVALDEEVLLKFHEDCKKFVMDS
ncbi:MAG: hypothetical protein ACE5I9_02850 [Candidatus Methylomirabilales bacterium]